MRLRELRRDQSAYEGRQWNDRRAETESVLESVDYFPRLIGPPASDLARVGRLVEDDAAGIGVDVRDAVRPTTHDVGMVDDNDLGLHDLAGHDCTNLPGVDCLANFRVQRSAGTIDPRPVDDRRPHVQPSCGSEHVDVRPGRSAWQGEIRDEDYIEVLLFPPHTA